MDRTDKFWLLSNHCDSPSKGPRAQTTSTEADIPYLPMDASKMQFDYLLRYPNKILDVPQFVNYLTARGANVLSDVAWSVGVSNGYLVSKNFMRWIKSKYDDHCHFYDCFAIIDGVDSSNYYSIMHISNRIKSIDQSYSLLSIDGNGWSYVGKSAFVIDARLVDKRLKFWRDDDTGIVIARDCFKKAFQKSKMTGLTFFPLLSEMPPELAQERLEENARRRSGYYLNQDGGSTNS